MSKISEYIGRDVKGYHFHCPGCDTTHGVVVEGSRNKTPVWSFTGGEENPTFHPSILVKFRKMPESLQKDDKGNYLVDEEGYVLGSSKVVCHSFVENGHIRFLNDCTHKLAGKTVPLPDFDD